MLKILAGSSNPELASEIASYTGTRLTPVKLSKFKDGERYVKIKDTVRGHDVFIIQSTSSPANDNLMELLLMIDAAKRASASSVTAVIPYYGYARQDRMVEPREPISAKLVANMIQTAGADRVLTIDLHSRQLQGFFDIPVDDLWAAPVFKEYFENINDLVVVAPDAGGVPRARHLAKRLNAPIAVIDKRRDKHNESEVMNILGEVKGKNAIILDDIIDTGGTMYNAGNAIKKAGARNVYICASHGVFSNNAQERLAKSEAEEIVVTNTIAMQRSSKTKVVSIAPLLGAAINNIERHASVSALTRTDLKTKLVLKKDE